MKDGWVEGLTCCHVASLHNSPFLTHTNLSEDKLAVPYTGGVGSFWCLDCAYISQVYKYAPPTTSLWQHPIQAYSNPLASSFGCAVQANDPQMSMPITFGRFLYI